MIRTGQSRPAKKYTHTDPKIEAEFKNIYAALAKLDTGAFRLLPVTEASVSYLYVQFYNDSTDTWTSRMRLSSAGVLDAEGAMNATAALPDEGNG
jgi:hypothetical protein